MKTKLLGTLILTGAISTPTFADYNHQIMGRYANIDAEATFFRANGTTVDFSSEADAYGVQYRYFFDTVSSKNGPYRLNEFLDPSSQIAISYSDVDVDSDVETDGSFGVFGKYVFGNGFIARVNYEEEPEVYSASLGYYLTPTTEINLIVSDCDDDCDTTASLSYRHYQKLSGDNGVDLGVGYNNIGEDFDSLAIFADYYFNKQLSLGAIYETDFDDNDGYGIDAAYWFQPNIGINISYVKSEDDESDIEVDATTISAQFRF